MTYDETYRATIKFTSDLAVAVSLCHTDPTLLRLIKEWNARLIDLIRETRSRRNGRK